MPDLLKAFTFSKEVYEWEWLNAVTILSVNAFLLPVALLRNLSSLRYFSLIGFFSVVYTVIVTTSLIYLIFIS